jgi:hypothetical protein
LFDVSGFGIFNSDYFKCFYRDNTDVITMEKVSMSLNIFLQISSVIPVKIKSLPRTLIENCKGYCMVKPEAGAFPK